MELLTYFIVLFFIIAFIALLPLISGVGSYKYVPNKKHSSSLKKEKADDDEFQGYVPLEEQLRKEQDKNKKVSTLSKLKKVKITKENVPLKFTTAVPTTGNQSLRNRKARTLESLNTDPNVYDYDLDELINDVQEEDNEEKQSEFQTLKAKDQNQLEDLI